MAPVAIPTIEPRLIVPVVFRPTNQVLHYDAQSFPDLRWGEAVIAETRFGPQVGWVRQAPKLMANAEVVSYQLLGRAGLDDVQRYYQLREKARKDMPFVEAKIRQHNLPMRLLDAEYPLDENQLVVYFTAEGRVDFRALVADLKQSFPKRVMLFQVGARDAIRTIGAVGPCGRPTCCSTFLAQLESVTMRMAKDQMLDLNPSRLLGACGKLKCCIRFEHELYQQLLSYLPKLGQWIETPQGRGRVIGLSILSLRVTVELESGGYGTWQAEELPGYEEPTVSSQDNCGRGNCSDYGSGNCCPYQIGSGGCISQSVNASVVKQTAPTG